LHLSQDQENFVKAVCQALVDWWGSLGAAAWILAGLLLVLALTVAWLTLRWIWQGNLRRSFPPQPPDRN
jgi:hypothetical protein